MDTVSKRLLTEDSIKELKRLKDLYPERKSIVLMVLHVIYRQFGFLETEAINEAAGIVDIPPMDFPPFLRLRNPQIK